MLNQIRGVILGTAIGDALGMPIEGMKPHKIKKLYGKVTKLEEPQVSHPYHNLKRGQWTDDTQLTIAIVESLIEKKCIDFNDIAQKHVKYVDSPRGYGKATLNSIKRIRDGVNWWDSGEVGSAGNGPAMKMAPIGILRAMNVIDDVEMFSACFNISRMTHKDSRAITAGCLQAWIISRYFEGPEKIKSSFVFEIYNQSSYIECSIGLSDQPLYGALSRMAYADHLSDKEIREMFGVSSFVNHSIPFTYSMVLKYINSPNQGLVNIVNQGGDADTTGAIAGAIYGALYGEKVFSKSFTEHLEDKDKLIEIADKLYDTFRGD